MSIDLNRLQKTIFGIESRLKTVQTAYPIITGIFFFILSHAIVGNNISYLDRVIFVLIGMILGRSFGTLEKINLEERKMVLEGYLELHSVVNKPVESEPVPPKTEEEKLPETATTAIEAVVKVEIPADAALPNIPSIAVPEDVKDALKGKGRPTKVPMKKKIKT